MKPLLQFEKLALGLLAFLLGFAFLADEIKYGDGLILVIPFALSVISGVLFAIFGVAFAINDDAPRLTKLRAGAAVPAVLIVALMLSAPTGRAGRWTSGNIHLVQNRAMFETQIRRSRGRITIFPYRNGMLGSGQTIVHLVGATDRRQPERVLKRIYVGDYVRCERLRDVYFLCVHG